MQINILSLKNLIPIFLFVFIFTECGEPQLNSNWRKQVITIDGSRADWEGKLTYFEDEKSAIGVMNDSEYVYFCLTTADRNTIMKILRNGFTIWLDPQNSDGSTYGIQYPIRKAVDTENNELLQEERSFNLSRRDDQRNNDDVYMRKSREKISPMMIEKFKSNQNEILVVNEDNFPLNVFKLKNEHGLEANINFEENQLVYELRVPIAKNKQGNFYTDVLPDEKLEVRFESGKIKRVKSNEKEGEGRKGGMRPPGDEGDGMMIPESRRAGQKGNRLNGRNMSDLTEPIDFSIIVILASK